MEIDLDAILLTFSAETEERLGEMEEALIALEVDPQDEKPLEAIFRGAIPSKVIPPAGFPR
jgi:chemotaxis protein histidine kinase CheA